jgi:hypothetical protein
LDAGGISQKRKRHATDHPVGGCADATAYLRGWPGPHARSAACKQGPSGQALTRQVVHHMQSAWYAPRKRETTADDPGGCVGMLTT